MYISIFSAVFPLGVGISRIKALHRGMNILLYYLVFAFAADMYLTYFTRGYKLTLALYHIYYLVEFIFIMSIIAVWQESPKMKRYFQLLIPIYTLFWIVAKFSFEPLFGLYSIIACTSQVLLVIGAEFTLYVIIKNRIHLILNHNRFWVLFSFVIYYAGTILVVALRGILINYSRETLVLVGSIDWSLKIVFNILFTVGFLCPQTKA
jgi:hypothetical protein